METKQRVGSGERGAPDVHTGEAVAGGEDALAPPKYWDDVKDPTDARYSSSLVKRTPTSTSACSGNLHAHARSERRHHSLGPPRTKPVPLEDVRGEAAATCSASICLRRLGARGSSSGGRNRPSACRRPASTQGYFRGCSSDLAPKILQQGFNRSFCGKHNTLYGKGVYFARDASYSTPSPLLHARRQGYPDRFFGPCRGWRVLQFRATSTR